MNINKIILISLILISVLIISPAIAKTIEAKPRDLSNSEDFSIYTNGYRWLEYSNKEKLLYVVLISNKFSIDNAKYPTKKMIVTLDHLYDLANQDKQGDELDSFLVLPCTVVLSGFIDALKEDSEKYRKHK